MRPTIKSKLLVIALAAVGTFVSTISVWATDYPSFGTTVIDNQILPDQYAFRCGTSNGSRGANSPWAVTLSAGALGKSTANCLAPNVHADAGRYQVAIDVSTAANGHCPSLSGSNGAGTPWVLVSGSFNAYSASPYNCYSWANGGRQEYRYHFFKGVFCFPADNCAFGYQSSLRTEHYF